MGFATDEKGGHTESLYVSDNAGPGGVGGINDAGTPGAGKGVAKLDLTTMQMTRLQPGTYTGPNAGFNAELTGTGDADLYGFFTTSPGGLAKIDKTTGATPMTTSLPTINASTGGYAFSFWGGDFWFYTAPVTNSTVSHYQTSTGAITVSEMLTFTIVGAGVSTCAPTVPPQ
jgi:hypothetical protein